MPIEIHTKTGCESELTGILKAYEIAYPHKYRYFMSALRKMREVQKRPDGSFVDRRGRWARINIRVPTELWLFIQHRIEGFGKDYKDVELLQRIARDFLATGRGHKTRIYSTTDHKKKKEDEDKRRDDSSERREDSGTLYPELKGQSASTSG